MSKKIGELLEEFDLIDPKQLEGAIKEQKRTGERLGDVIIRRGLVTAEDLELILSRQHSVPSINLEQYMPPPEVIALVPERYMREKMVVPVELRDKVLTVAMADPRQYQLIDELCFMTGKNVSPVVSTQFGIRMMLEKLFPTEKEEVSDATVSDIPLDIETDKSEGAMNLPGFSKMLAALKPSHVAKAILTTAANMGATNLHIKRTDSTGSIRVRVDSHLSPPLEVALRHARDIVKGLKDLASIDEKVTVARQGFFDSKLAGDYFRVTIAAMPTSNGESVVVTMERPKANAALTLDVLGMYPEMLAAYREVISKPKGLIIYASPPASGKTATIYATLDELSSPELRTVTIESPIRRKLENVEQFDPMEIAGLDSAALLQSMLAQDVDHLMVADLSSPQVLKAALRASQNGALVLGHVDYPGALACLDRMVSVMGASASLIASELLAVVGQRLVDMLCSHCLVAQTPEDDQLLRLIRLTGRRQPQVYTAKGCDRCGGTGRAGKVGIFELLHPTDKVKQLIINRTPERSMREILKAEGTRTLSDDGLMKASDGLVSYEDVLSVL